MTWLLAILATLAFGVLVLRLLTRLVSWRLVAALLAIAVAVTTGLANPDPVTAALQHTITNLFGGTT
jgi:H+/gluconate symporter-like permease